MEDTNDTAVLPDAPAPEAEDAVADTSPVAEETALPVQNRPAFQGTLSDTSSRR